ncbi:MAG: hypothetical protein JXR25_01845 [Pontiellaceae bacterium]|nr:hypothetical protein [Pontiellaceae bacterium]MBN2783541.1 hypothetical protein [Pontiellaceae bacterium]
MSIVLISLAAAQWSWAAATSTYRYNATAMGGDTIESQNSFSLEMDSEYRFSSGYTSRDVIASGYAGAYTGAAGLDGFPVYNWITTPGDGHSRTRFSIDSENGILRAHLQAESREKYNDVNFSVSTLLDMNARQYYRATGSEPLTLRLSFHYDGTWDAGGYQPDNYASVRAGTYLTLVKDETQYFDGNSGGFAQGLEINLFTDVPAGAGFYDFCFGDGQKVAETLAYSLYDSTSPKYLSSGELNEDYTYDVVVNPGELLLVDTMFNGHVSVCAGNDKNHAEVDFLNTTYSSVEIISGDGSLIRQDMPVAIPEPATVTMLGGAALVLGVIRRRLRI